jgi:c-di-GMP-binding flagellar brake protein YcgR
MLNLATRAAEPAAAELDDSNQYTVASRLEIVQILTAIMRQGTLVTASPGDDSFFLTAVTAVDEEKDFLMLECGRQQQQIDLILKRQRLMCSTALDKVKIQFLCEGIKVAGDGNERTFKSPLPREMIRLQRREHFRMPIPLSAQLKCELSPIEQEPQKTAKKIELGVHDISCGGIAVMTPPAIFTPELGVQYNAVISLPGGSARAVIQARNAFMVTLANGKVTQRSGFAFVRPAESLLAAIQRYIMNLERARRMSDRGR